MRVYLDVCCLNRPFDDQAVPRIRLEAEAVVAVLAMCESGAASLVGSIAIDQEVAHIHREDRRERVRLLCRLVSKWQGADDAVKEHAQVLIGKGFSAMDALHVACAKRADADVFLTTDDRLVKLGKKHRAAAGLRLVNPVAWILEVTQHEN